MSRKRLAALMAVVLIGWLSMSAPTLGATFTYVQVAPQNPIADYDTTQSYTVNISGASATPARCIQAHFNYSSITLPDPPNAHWQYSGGATHSTDTITLTTPSQSFAGAAAVYDVALPVDGITASFDGYMGGGGGADGMTFVLLDSTAWGGYAGSIGGGLGYSGLTGVAVTMDTSQNGSDPSSNFIGIATSGSGSNITYAATSTAVPSLRNTPRHYEVTATSNSLTVSIDGVQYLSQAVTLPPTVLVGFTAGTGGSTDYHRFSDISISSVGAGPTGTGLVKPADMGTSGPALTGSTAVTAANWAISGTAVPDGVAWTYSTGQALSTGVLTITNITRNPAVAGTYYLRIDTYTDTSCTTPLDTGYGSYSIISAESSLDVSLMVSPHLTFGVAGYNAGTCNGANLTNTSSTSTLVSLSMPTSSSNVVAGQTLTMETNAANGYSALVRYTDSVQSPAHTIDDWTGTNAAPTTFASPGTEAFGYTTDHALSGSATRFQTNKWAKLTTSGDQVSYSSGPVASDVAHVCYQVGVAAITPAGSYSTTIVYTVVPNF